MSNMRDVAASPFIDVPGLSQGMATDYRNKISKLERDNAEKAATINKMIETAHINSKVNLLLAEGIKDAIKNNHEHIMALISGHTRKNGKGGNSGTTCWAAENSLGSFNSDTENITFRFRDGPNSAYMREIAEAGIDISKLGVRDE